MKLQRCRFFPDISFSKLHPVFQLFRFEVHLRITDETGQHIQHMGTAANPSDSFLFSSLFDGDSGVMVGGSGHLSNFCGDMGDPFTGKNTTEALLSSLRAEELCCGLVDEFVSRTSGKEDGMFGPQSSWKMGFTSDWNIFGSSSDGSCHKSSSEEERSSPWSSEEDQNVTEFDSEDSRKLWDSLSRSSDPYNPFFFSACISTNTERQNTEPDLMPVSETSMEILGSGNPGGRCTWVSRSDSETSWSSDGSTLDEDTEQLLEFFTNSDPYNPLCFTACTSTSPPNAATSASLPALPPIESSPLPSSEDDEEAQLWKSLCIQDDPYHPLNFKAHLQSSAKTTTSPTASCGGQHPLMSDQKVAKAKNKPHLPERHFKHQHPETTMVPWTRPRTTGRKDNKAGSTHKKVFSQLHDRNC